MLRKKLISKFNTYSTNFIKIPKKYFKMLTPDEYLINMTESLKRTGVEACKLRPLPEASKYK